MVPQIWRPCRSVPSHLSSVMSRNWLIWVRTTTILNLLTFFNIPLYITALRNRPVAHTFLPSFDNASGRLCQERLGSLSKYDGKARKDHLKSEFALFQISSLLFHFIHFVNCWRIFLELNSKGLYLIWAKEQENCCLIFMSPKFVKTKFHVPPSLHALKDWWDKSNVRWFLREQTIDKVCQ